MINFRKCLKQWSAHPGRCFVAALPCVYHPQSHLCNSISVLQWALIDLFRRSTKWLAKSHSSSYPSLLLLVHPTQTFQWHTALFIILSLLFQFITLISPLFNLSCHYPSSQHCFLTLFYSPITAPNQHLTVSVNTQEILPFQFCKAHLTAERSA